MPSLDTSDVQDSRGALRWWSLPRLGLERLEAWHRRKAAVERFYGHSFLRRPLSPGAAVLDVGAHAGSFGSFLREKYGCQITMVEPLPERLRVSDASGIRVVAAAMSAQAGPRKIFLSRNPEATSFYETIAGTYCVVGAREVETCTLEAVLQAHCPNGAALVKLDIEGEEVPVLLAAPPQALASIAQLSVEFHDFLEDRPRRAEVEMVLKRLRRLNFVQYVMSRAWGCHEDTLLINRRLVHLSVGERLHLWLLTRVTLAVQSMRRYLAIRVRQLAGRSGT